MFRNIFEKPSRKNDFYLFTDGLELYCLATDPKSGIQKSSYEHVLRHGEDFNPEENESGEINDRTTTLCEEIFQDIQTRMRVYNDLYPFEYIEEEDCIRLKENLTDRGIVYLVLLCTANLNKVNASNNFFTSFLEIAGVKVLEQLFPNAEVRLFGSSNCYSGLVTAFNETKLKDRLSALSVFINQPVKNLDTILDTDTGDKGLDIIAKISINDELSSNPLIFVQCASSNEEWSNKQNDISRTRWSHFVDYNDTSVLNFIFIPQSFRDISNKWFNHTKIMTCVLFDRHRICSNIGSYDVLFETKAFKLIREIVA